MHTFLAILLTVVIVLVIILQVKSAKRNAKPDIRWQSSLALSGFALGFISVLFIAAKSSNPVSSNDVLLALLVGIFSASGFGWSIPEKMRRIYRRKE